VEFYPITEPALPSGTERQIEFKTLISTLDTGREYRRRKWIRPRRSFRLKYQYLTQEQADKLWNFFVRHQGAFQPFLFRFPYKTVWENEFVAQGDGTTKEFDLPAVEASAVEVFIDGTPTPFSLLPGAGDWGKDRISLPEPPPAGSFITATFEGYLVITARFAEDVLNSQIFKAYLQTVGIGIVEVV